MKLTYKQLIIMILEDSGAPMKLKDIYKEVYSSDRDILNFNLDAKDIEASIRNTLEVHSTYRKGDNGVFVNEQKGSGVWSLSKIMDKKRIYKHSDIIELIEGTRRVKEITYTSRDPKIKNLKKEYLLNNDACEYCGSKVKFYGGNILIAHHVKPISKYEEGKFTTNKNDISFICPNCHQKIHNLKKINEINLMNKEQQISFVKNLK